MLLVSLNLLGALSKLTPGRIRQYRRLAGQTAALLHLDSAVGQSYVEAQVMDQGLRLARLP
jgi:hypothetical protein